MIKRATIEDLEFVTMVMNHPDIKPYLGGDVAKGIMIDYGTFLQHEAFYFGIPIMNGEKIGVFAANPISPIMYLCHDAILPEFRGKIAIEAGKEAVSWMFKNTKVLKLIFLIPVIYRHSHLFALKVGGKPEGMNRKSYLLDGKLHDQHWLGITKEEWKWDYQRRS